VLESPPADGRRPDLWDGKAAGRARDSLARWLKVD